MNTRLTLHLLCAALCGSFHLSVTFAEPIEIAKIERDKDVDFAKEILPVFRKKCLACHNESDAESDLVLETPEAMIKGGTEGPALVAGNSAESYLFQLASHQDEPIMPPEDNEVGAAALTPQELGLLKLWIDQGAKAGDLGTAEIAWQPLPAGVNPVLSVATTLDGQVVAVGRANQIFLHHGTAGISYGRLTDPELLKSEIYKQPGVAHLDMVQSLAFSPDGTRLASGGYRTAKIWKRASHVLNRIEIPGESHTLSPSLNGQEILLALSDGSVKRMDANTGAVADLLQLEGTIVGVGELADRKTVVAASKDKLYVHRDGKTSAAIQAPAPIVAFQIGGENQILTAHADKKIRGWNGNDTILSESSVFESDQPITGMSGMTSNQKIAYSLPGGKVRVLRWNDKKQSREISHGANVTQLAISSNGERLVTYGEDKSVKLWNLTDGKQIQQLTAAPDLAFRVKASKFERDVANRRVANSNKDLDGANKRHKQEEDNLKKSEEKKKSAEADRTKKEEAAKKAETERANAEKALSDLKASIPAAETTIMTSQAQIAKAKPEFDLALAKLAVEQAAFATVADELAKAISARDSAKTASEANNDDVEAAKELANAEEALKRAMAQHDAAGKKRLAAFQTANAANTKRESAENAIKAANERKAKAEKEIKPAEKSLADKQKARDNANNQLKDSVRSVESATSSVAQAKSAIERARIAIEDAKKIVAAREAVAKEKEAQFKNSESARNEFKFEVGSMQFSKSGDVFAFSTTNGRVFVWASQDGSPVSQFDANAHRGMVFIDANRVATIGSGGTVDIATAIPTWALERVIGSPNGKSELSDRVTALCFSPDSKQLAVGGGEPSRSGELRIYDPVDGRLIRDLPETHSDTVFGISYSPNGKQIATCAADRFMKVSDVDTGKVVKTFEGHTHHVLSVSWQADGRVLATAGADKVVKIWNYQDGSQLKTIQGFGKEVTSLRHFGPNDNFVAVSGDQSVYSCNAGGSRKGIGKANDFLYCVSVSPVGNTIAFAGHDSIVRVIDEKGKSVTTLEPPK